MAKLIIVVAIALTVLVAFVSAHTTIITTTIDDENPISEHQECRQRLREQEFHQCRTYLQLQGQTQTPCELDNKHKEKKKHQEEEQDEGLQQCCHELKNVDKQCQCEAVKQVFRDVQTQQQQQGGEYHSQEMEQLKHRAQNLPNKCKLETKRCKIGTIMTTTTTITEYDNPFWPVGSKQCSQREVQGRVNQCQRYVEEQIFRSPRTILMSTNYRREQEQQGLQECCNELQNMRKECQCEAMKEVMRQAKQQQQQGGEYSKQDEQMQVVRHVVRSLPNQCGLDVEQCHMPYEMY